LATPPTYVLSYTNNAGVACATPQDILKQDIYEWRLSLSLALADSSVFFSDVVQSQMRCFKTMVMP